jgi:hypothetical protein
MSSAVFSFQHNNNLGLTVLLLIGLEHLFVIHTGDAIDEHFIFASPFVVYTVAGSQGHFRPVEPGIGT